MSAPSRYLGQRFLAAFIRVYQRFVSGRGPLSRVMCTFGHTESCSAYGLRATERVARSLPQALRLIFARIARCGGTSLYRAGGATLLWGEELDRDPEALDAVLRGAGELCATRAGVLRARALVARHAGDAAAMHWCVHTARGLVPEASNLVIRSGAGLLRRHRQRLLSRLAIATLALVLVVWLMPAEHAAFAGVSWTDCVFVWLRRHARRVRRFDRQLVAARFRGKLL